MCMVVVGNHIIRAASGQEVCLNSQSEDVLRNTPFSVFKRAERVKGFSGLTDKKKTNCMYN